jgi:hypothetical protein
MAGQATPGGRASGQSGREWPRSWWQRAPFRRCRDPRSRLHWRRYAGRTGGPVDDPHCRRYRKRDGDGTARIEHGAKYERGPGRCPRHCRRSGWRSLRRADLSQRCSRRRCLHHDFLSHQRREQWRHESVCRILGSTWQPDAVSVLRGSAETFIAANRDVYLLGFGSPGAGQAAAGKASMAHAVVGKSARCVAEQPVQGFTPS